MPNFTIIDVEQRSPEWYAARLGRLTGSRAGDMLAMDYPDPLTPTGRPSKAKPKEKAGRRNLRVELVLQRIMGRSLDTDFISQAMQAGIDREPLAYAAFEALTGQLVQRTGFLAHDTHLAGCSLDGHIGDFDELVSLKCRQPAAHLEFLRSGKIPADALAQIRHELWITGARLHHYFSWNPDFPDALQARVVTIARADADVEGYEKAALAFLAEVEVEVSAVRTMNNIGSVLREAVA